MKRALSSTFRRNNRSRYIFSHRQILISIWFSIWKFLRLIKFIKQTLSLGIFCNHSWLSVNIKKIFVYFYFLPFFFVGEGGKSKGCMLEYWWTNEREFFIMYGKKERMLYEIEILYWCPESASSEKYFMKIYQIIHR